MPRQTRRRSSSMEPTVAPTRAGASSPPWVEGGDRDSAAKRRRRRDPLWARLLVIIGAVLMVSSGGLIAGSKALIKNATSTIRQGNLLGEAGKTEAEGGNNLSGPIDLLLLGVDVRGSWGPNETRPDSIIILHIPATHDRAYLVSIPRDTEAQIPPFPKSKYPGGTDKVNAAFFFGAQNGSGWSGGTALLAQTIKKLTGVSFDGAAIIDFNGFRSVIDALGTIPMCVDQQVTSHHMVWVDGKPMWNSDAEKTGKKMTPIVHKVGCREMQGWEALDYSRQRYGLKNGDYDRQRHQQQLLKAMAAKAISGGVMTNPLKLNALLKAAGKAFTLDTGGVPIADFVFTMRGVTANELTLLRTNDGGFSSNENQREVLKPISKEMFAAVNNDSLAGFIVRNPTVVASDK